MTPRQKFVWAVVAGFAIPAIIVAAGNHWLAYVAITIAWWHGYMAARFEAAIPQPQKLEP